MCHTLSYIAHSRLLFSSSSPARLCSIFIPPSPSSAVISPTIALRAKGPLYDTTSTQGESTHRHFCHSSTPTLPSFPSFPSTYSSIRMSYPPADYPSKISTCIHQKPNYFKIRNPFNLRNLVIPIPIPTLKFKKKMFVKFLNTYTNMHIRMHSTQSSRNFIQRKTL